MKLYIPDIGDTLTILKDWEFTLYPEARNAKLARIMGFKQYFSNENYWAAPEGIVAINAIHIACQGIAFDHEKYNEMVEAYSTNNPDKFRTSFNVTIKKGTILSIDRVSIKKGARDFSSLSFIIEGGPYKGARFWAKLEDINKMEVDFL